jgi:hypothetical protein
LREPDAQAAVAPAPSPAPSTADQSLNFNLLAEPAPGPSAKQLAKLNSEVSTRRTMLKIHQSLGLVTLTGLAATVIVGQLAFDNKFRGGGDNNQYTVLHYSLAGATTTLFATVALLGLLAPVPYPKPLRLDTATLHKSFMALAAAFLLSEIFLGLATAGHEGSLAQRDYGAWHQGLGYASFAAMSVGASVWLF